MMFNGDNTDEICIKVSHFQVRMKSPVVVQKVRTQDLPFLFSLAGVGTLDQIIQD